MRTLDHCNEEECFSNQVVDHPKINDNMTFFKNYCVMKNISLHISVNREGLDYILKGLKLTKKHAIVGFFWRIIQIFQKTFLQKKI